MNNKNKQKIALRKLESKTNTINFHFYDSCNFRCKHCFVNMQNKSLTFAEAKQIVDILKENYNYNRINLAGGEPLLSPYIQPLIDYIVFKGFTCSLVTNGSMLTEEFVELNKTKLQMIGISVDSLNDETNQLIGRKKINNLIPVCKKIKEVGIKLKINVCVLSYNKHENLSSFLQKVKPDRFKIFQAIPSPHKPDSHQMIVSDNEFLEFCARHQTFGPICENDSFIKDGYDIVDAEGVLSNNNLRLGKSVIARLL